MDFNDIEHLALKILVNEEGSKNRNSKKNMNLTKLKSMNTKIVTQCKNTF